MAPIEIAATAVRRLRGICGTPEGSMVMLVPCRDVHTIGLVRPIDVAFVDGDGVVLSSYRRVGPRRRLRHARAAAVVERWSKDEEAWFSQGDRLEMTALSSCGTAPKEQEARGRS